MNNPQNSAPRPSSKKRRSGRRKQRGPKTDGPRAQAQAPQNANRQGPGTKSSRGARRRRRNTGPKLSALDRLIVKVENLRQAHIEARRKYYELFDRADPRQKDKLERQFTHTMKLLRDFEEGLNEHDRKLYQAHYDAYPEDLTYAQNHELTPEGEAIPFSGDFEDPHELESQKQSSFADDTQESVGTLEDYKAYKGL